MREEEMLERSPWKVKEAEMAGGGTLWMGSVDN